MTYPEPIFLTGNDRLTCSIAVCLLRGGHTVTLCTENKEYASGHIQMHIKDLANAGISFQQKDLQIIDRLNHKISPKIVIALTRENLQNKKSIIHHIEGFSSKDTIIAINTDSISLDKLQEDSGFPDRIIGLNWTEPAHTTFFLELVTNTLTLKEYVERVLLLSKSYWDKNPYIVSCGYSIRARLFAALAREGFYLVQNDFASVEDIDRACRNDPGYYMPFSGKCRYMDLMGAYAYGIVMKSLNQDLSKSADISPFFQKIIEECGNGIENGKGFYTYTEEEIKNWDKISREFSYKIQEIIRKYPFNYPKGDLPSKN